MESRIAKLESDVGHIKTDIRDIKTDIREIRSDVKNCENNLRADMKTDFRLMFSALIFVALGLAAIMARGFNWL